MESSRRDLFNDVAKHGCTSKTSQTTYDPVLISHPYGQDFLKQMFPFYRLKVGNVLIGPAKRRY